MIPKTIANEDKDTIRRAADLLIAAAKRFASEQKFGKVGVVIEFTNGTPTIIREHSEAMTKPSG